MEVKHKCQEFHLHNVLHIAQRSHVLVVKHICKYEPLKEAVAFL